MTGSRTILSAAFLFTACLPYTFNIFDQELSLARLFIVICSLPLLLSWRSISGCSAERNMDVGMFVLSIWLASTLLLHEGLSRLNLAIITALEILVPYGLGKALIRSVYDLNRFSKIWLISIFALFPATLLEMFTNENILQSFFQIFGDTFTKGDSSYGRLGLNRVMSGFEHPILFGTYALMFAPFVFYFSVGYKRFVHLSIVSITVFSALSSGPLISLVLQFALIAYLWIFGQRWKQLLVVLMVIYVVVDILSNRTPATILAELIALDPATAWTRINTFTFASRVIEQNPIFGIGFADWERPHWLTSSIDNYWLLLALRHGVPAFVFAFFVFSYPVVVLVGRLKDATDFRILNAYMFTVISLIASFTTVHLWGNLQILVYFLLGCFPSLLTAVHQISPVSETRSESQSGSAFYTRFH